MKAPRFLLRTLNVRSEEWWLVQKLFFLQFFQGASIAFFFTAAFSYFLTRFPITELPYVIILSAFLLWLTGFVYHKLEHRLAFSKLSIIIALIILGSILVFGAGSTFIEAGWFFYLMLSWFNVLYLLNNLEFWGLASQLYDVRQSKRLFGVISAGDIPAKFIGYFVASIIIKIFGENNALLETQYLLAAAFLSMIISLPFWVSIARKGVFSRISQKDMHKSATHLSPVKGILKDFTVNTLIRRIAVISAIAYVCFILTNYAFYSEVQLRRKSDQSLAGFIASFYVIARLAALCMKMIFTSRLIRSLGYKTSMLIVPISLILFTFLFYIAPAMTNSERTVFYIFGAAAMAIEALRTSLIVPVLLTLMQPLHTTERLRAHNIVKGIMDPFAYLFSGLLLLLLFQMQQYSLITISNVLLALSIIWIAGIILVHQQYLKTLIRTVSSRYFSQEEFNLYDKATRGLVEEKIENGNELEVLYVLNMLASRAEDQSKWLVIKAFHHPSSKVIAEAIRMVDVQQIREANVKLRQLIQNHPDPLIRSEAIKVLSKSDFDESMIASCMRHTDIQVQQAAIVAALNQGNDSLKDEAKNKLFALLHSTLPEQRKEGIVLVAELNTEEFNYRLKELLYDSDKKVVESAIRAIAKKDKASLLADILSKWENHEKTVVEALVKAGDLSIPVIRNELLGNVVASKKADRLIFTCGRIGTENAQHELIQFLNHLPHKSAAIIKALNRCRYTPQPAEQRLFESITREYLVSAAEILHMQKRLHPDNAKYSLLQNSLEIELNETREVLLCLFSFLYDREKIAKVKNALLLRKKELQANAFELVEMTVKKDFAHSFNTVFEQASIEDRCAALKHIFPKDSFPEIENILTKILAEDKFSYNHWTRACSLYTSKKYVHRIHEGLIRKYLHSDNFLLKQTAEYAV